jgi:[acyl-carrier-protein] S-malonyltransferase
MQRASSITNGCMAAVMGLATDQIETVARDTGVTFANDNSPTQGVISGTDAALAEAATRVRELGGRTVLLPVDGAYHSGAMEPAIADLEETLERTDIRSPNTPVLSNISAQPYRAPGEIRKLLLLQLTSKVRFRESISWLIANGVDDFVDLGPGRIVGRLAQATARSHEVAA